MVAIGVSEGELVSIEPKYLTRHGLIAGSTGSGKSRAMQVMAEQLADKGANVFVSDIKGDASGFCMKGAASDRNTKAPYQPHGIETNYWSLSERFIPLRFSLSTAGSVLISKLLSLNPTQESHLSLAFSYSRKNEMPLDSLDDLLAILETMLEKKARGISKSSISVIERKILAMQESGLDSLFGKPELKIKDVTGMNVLNLSDSRKNMLASIAPAFLLQKLFDNLPEKGDVDFPEFVIFFDEAHYLFKDSNKSLVDLMVTILKQIRSKGVSVFFVTQDVTDLPDDILSQLSTKLIFSQKVFTQKGIKRLRALASSFPESDVDVMEELKMLSPGNAIISTLNESGNQTEPRKVSIFAPATTMEVVEDQVLAEATDPKLMEKYSRKKTYIPKKTEIRAQPEKKKDSFKFFLKLLDFIIRAFSKILTAMVAKPGKHIFKYLTKKPVRIIYLLLFLLLVYVILINWSIIESALAALDFTGTS